MRAALALLLATTASAEPPPCIPAFRFAERVTLTGNAVQFCDDESPKKQQCFEVDLGTGRTQRAKVAAPPDSAESDVTLAIAGKRAKVCRAGACKTLTPKARVDEGLAMHGTARGRLAVLINRDQIETFTTAGKRIARFSAGKGDCTRVGLLAGDVLLIANRFCGDDEQGTHWFATAKGKSIAAVGGDKPVHVAEPLLLDDGVAFVAIKGDEIIVQDGKTVTSRIPLDKAASDVWPTLAGDARRFVVVFGGDRAGDVVVVDRATEKLARHAAARCP